MIALIVVEHDEQTPKPTTYNALTAANSVAEEVHVLVAGDAPEEVAKQLAQAPLVNKVLIAQAPELAHGLAEPWSELLATIGADYDYVIAASSTFAKNILPRTAALLQVGALSDVIEILSQDTFKRPIYAGNAIATVQSLDTIKVITVRAPAFHAATKTGGDAPQVTLSLDTLHAPTTFLEETLNRSARPDLTNAKIIVAGGRGLGSQENFQLLERLADQLNAAIGASRAAVDAGFVPNDYQVGQTGKIVAPELYIAVGISGAVQHLAGMKDSKIIVAINKDPNAPIFEIATYKLVGDLFQILPELEQLLTQG